MNKELIVAWQMPKNKEWIPVGRLKEYEENYRFYYTFGAKRAEKNGFYLVNMNQKDKFYTCSKDSLFPVFANRLLAKSRPEYKLYQSWLNLGDNSNALDELAKNNGKRATDNIELYLIPPQKNFYEIDFFSHGISHLIPSYQERIKKLEIGEKLYIAKDIQNEYDKFALLIRTKDPMEIVGYVPRIYAKDITKLLAKDKKATLEVSKINKDAPLQFQLLCKFKAKWYEGFKPFATKDYKRILNQ